VNDDVIIRLRHYFTFLSYNVRTF